MIRHGISRASGSTRDCNSPVVLQPDCNPRARAALRVAAACFSRSRLTWELGELIGYLLACLAVERGTLGLPGGWIAAYGHLRHPAPIGAPGDTTFIVSRFLGH